MSEGDGTEFRQKVQGRICLLLALSYDPTPSKMSAGTVPGPPDGTNEAPTAEDVRRYRRVWGDDDAPNEVEDRPDGGK